MSILRHDHTMWAVNGVYSGREDNLLWRRLPADGPCRIEAAGARSVGAGEGPLSRARGGAFRPEPDGPSDRGDPCLWRPTSSAEPAAVEWPPETLTARAFDMNRTRAEFARANRLFARDGSRLRPGRQRPAPDAPPRSGRRGPARLGGRFPREVIQPSPARPPPPIRPCGTAACGSRTRRGRCRPGPPAPTVGELCASGRRCATPVLRRAISASRTSTVTRRSTLAARAAPRFEAAQVPPREPNGGSGAHGVRSGAGPADGETCQLDHRRGPSTAGAERLQPAGHHDVGIVREAVVDRMRREIQAVDVIDDRRVGRGEEDSRRAARPAPRRSRDSTVSRWISSIETSTARSIPASVTGPGRRRRPRTLGEGTRTARPRLHRAGPAQGEPLAVAIGIAQHGRVRASTTRLAWRP